MGLKIRPLQKTFGAEISGLDLSKPLDSQTINEVKALWHQYEILLFRDQVMDEAEIVSFSKQLGDLEIHIRKEFLSQKSPEILYISNMTKEGKPVGILADSEVGWHYDQIYLPRPAVGSFLFSVILPSSGGETSFSDMSAVYEALPQSIKNAIDGKKALQSYEAFNALYSVPTSAEQKKKTPDIEHPIVRVHPYSGKKALYICPGMTTQIVGLDKSTSDDLLQELFAWSVKPEFVYSHVWQLGDGVLWDNACTMHRREPFDPKQERLMKRTTILPDPKYAVPV
ncbi:TauD/TfdA dioxygenase family protein [Polynucleobacter nymphae]|uniref:TauD/TfdA dioxygenase family protein n=1 Tax=Polynucleobacter nymphae TaxID=2081043 RepID=UPI001C0D4601|nr:TauD/TfdA family dioxygenase [Polynucleobacter nymphae]MBU3607710.1 TauD/TfdA family dioxygenase [Polynucleobacter nymphae]